MHRPTYTRRWFKQGDRQMWLNHLSYLNDRPARYLEIGVFEGRSLLWVASHLLRHPGSEAVGVDTWNKPTDRLPDIDMVAVWQKAIANTHENRKISLVRASSCEYLSVRSMDPTAAKFDLIYIDGSHRIEDVCADTGLAWKCLAGGGVIVWDDWKGLIRRLVNTFIETVQAEPVWHTRRQRAARKAIA